MVASDRGIPLHEHDGHALCVAMLVMACMMGVVTFFFAISLLIRYICTVGLQQSLIDSITVFSYWKEGGIIDDTECFVCLGEFEEDENLRLLPKCSHAFYIPYIDTWLLSQNLSHVSCTRAPSSRTPSNGSYKCFSRYSRGPIGLELEEGDLNEKVIFAQQEIFVFHSLEEPEFNLAFFIPSLIVKDALSSWEPSHGVVSILQKFVSFDAAAFGSSRPLAHPQSVVPGNGAIRSQLLGQPLFLHQRKKEFSFLQKLSYIALKEGGSIPAEMAALFRTAMHQAADVGSGTRTGIESISPTNMRKSSGAIISVQDLRTNPFEGEGDDEYGIPYILPPRKRIKKGEDRRLHNGASSLELAWKLWARRLHGCIYLSMLLYSLWRIQKGDSREIEGFLEESKGFLEGKVDIVGGKSPKFMVGVA
ncbi:hypothetical protein Fmac_015162 [Flemingia macrophylla]|uniref:RING-type E3 ubiquitin transferase n=1 Tax=Flemingia macrophylla TaxID=520843 RepID=A0ABD1MDX2_9FABA